MWLSLCCGIDIADLCQWLLDLTPLYVVLIVLVWALAVLVLLRSTGRVCHCGCCPCGNVLFNDALAVLCSADSCLTLVFLMLYSAVAGVFGALAFNLVLSGPGPTTVLVTCGS